MFKDVVKQLHNWQNIWVDKENKLWQRKKLSENKIKKGSNSNLQQSITKDFVLNSENSSITKQSSPNEKITLFMSLFRGRNDVFALRFENEKTKQSGYSPV